MLKYKNPGGPRCRPPQHEQRQVAVLQVRVLVLPHSKNLFEIISLSSICDTLNIMGNKLCWSLFFNSAWEDNALEAETVKNCT